MKKGEQCEIIFNHHYTKRWFETIFWTCASRMRTDHLKLVGSDFVGRVHSTMLASIYSVRIIFTLKLFIVYIFVLLLILTLTLFISIYRWLWVLMMFCAIQMHVSRNRQTHILYFIAEITNSSKKPHCRLYKSHLMFQPSKRHVYILCFHHNLFCGFC